MRLAVISFTEQGARLCRLLTRCFQELGEECRGYVMDRFYDTCHEAPGMEPLQTSVSEWTKARFQDEDGIIFVGAAGIAVRSVAPFLKGKTEDPAVVVIDEQGRFSISLLSGHIGGANELAVRVSEITGAASVITTATDLESRFAVDVFAARRNLAISDMGIAKRISADLLEGKKVGFYSDFPVYGEIPPGLTEKEVCSRAVWVTVKRRLEQDSQLTEVLCLIPRIVCLGIGCRKDVETERIARAVEAFLEEQNLAAASIGRIASIDLKKEEKGLTGFAEALGVPYLTYSSETLAAVPGVFTGSGFVQKTTGVDNVCERAAVLGAGSEGESGVLVGRKTALDGVTAAAAVKGWSLQFTEEISG